MKDTQHGNVGDVKHITVDSNRPYLSSSHFHSNSGHSDNRKMRKGLLFAERRFIFAKRTLSFLRCILGLCVLNMFFQKFNEIFQQMFHKQFLE